MNSYQYFLVFTDSDYLRLVPVPIYGSRKLCALFSVCFCQHLLISTCHVIVYSDLMFKITNLEFSSSFIHSNLKKNHNLDIINSTTAELKWPGPGRSQAGAGAGAGAAKILIRGRSRSRSRPKVGRLRNPV